MTLPVDDVAQCSGASDVGHRITTGAHSDGEHTVSIIATDAAGQPSPPSGA